MAQRTTPSQVLTNTTDGDTIDIYVFSNGQKYSPPRKYHLRTEELNWWKATLSFLARSQYGSLHSIIDLYTIDGKKLDEPAQLKNGAAYVAVEPPDLFIDTGYEKYLIKASRSWEKRQSRKSSNCDVITPEVLNIIIDTKLEVKPDHKKDLDDVKDVEQNLILTNLERNTEEPITLSVKPRINTVTQPTTRKTDTGSTLIRPNNNKRPATYRRPSNIMKNNTNQIISPLTSRKSSTKYSRNSPPRRNINSKTVKSINKPENGSVEKHLYKSGERKSYKNNNILTPTYGSDENEVRVERTLGTTLPPVKDLSDSKNTLTENTKNEISLYDNEVHTTNLYKNPKRELSSLVIDTEINRHINNKNENEIKHNLDESVPKLMVETLLDQVQQYLLVQTANRTPVVDRDDENIYKPCTCDEKVPCNNFCDVNREMLIINRGDEITLKLKIELENCCNNDKRNMVECISHTVPNIIKLEKVLQVENDINILAGRKCLQSILANDFTQDEGNNEVLRSQCRCCEHVDTFHIGTNDDDDDKKYVILLLKSKRNETDNRCQCSQIEKIKDDDSLKKNIAGQSIIYPLKKTFSTTSVERLTKLNNIPVITHQDLEKPTAKGNSATLYQNVNITNEVDNVDPRKEKSPTEEAKSIAPKLIEDFVKSEYVKIMPNTFDVFTKTQVDKGTQTEWGNVLVSTNLPHIKCNVMNQLNTTPDKKITHVSIRLICRRLILY